MYLRTTQRRNKDGSVVRYLALAENVRHPEKGYVEAKVVHSFGRADQLDRAALERLVAGIRAVLGDAGSGPGRGGGARVGRRGMEADFELGVVHGAKALWAKLGIGEVIQARLDEKQLQAPHATALLAMVAQRLDRPASKLPCHERWLDQVWLPEARDLGLHQLYRALDVLALYGDAVEQAVFWRAVDLFKLDVDLVFYDGTTAWFECDEEDVAGQEWRGLTFEPLRKRGHSVARAHLRAFAQARAQQGRPGQRPAGGDRPGRHPGWRAGALLGVPRQHARRHHGADDQG